MHNTLILCVSDENHDICWIAKRQNYRRRCKEFVPLHSENLYNCSCRETIISAVQSLFLHQIGQLFYDMHHFSVRCIRSQKNEVCPKLWFSFFHSVFSVHYMVFVFLRERRWKNAFYMSYAYMKTFYRKLREKARMQENISILK